MLPPGAGCPFPGAGDTGTGGAAAESCFLVIVIVVVFVIVVIVIVVVVDVGEEVDPCVGHDQHEAHVADGVEGASRPGGPGLVVDLLLKHHEEWPGLRLGSR